MLSVRLMAFFSLLGILVTSRSWSGDMSCPEAALTEPDEHNPDPDAIPVVRFVSYRAEYDTYCAAIDAFNAQNPDMRVTFAALPESRVVHFDPSEAGILRSARSGLQLGDVVEIQRADLTGFTKDFFLDLRHLIEGDPSFDLADYFPYALERMEDGGIYILPRALYNLRAISYNKALWQARGLPEPHLDWTWDNILQAAEQLTVATDGPERTYGFAQTVYGLGLLVDLEAAQGGELHLQEAATVDFHRPVFCALLERIRDLHQRGVLYLNADDSFKQTQEQIRAGNVGMWWGVRLHPRDIVDPPFPVGLIAYPETSRQYQSIITGFVINRITRYPNQAWRWLNFLSKQDIPSMRRWKMMDYPARRSLVAQGGPWEQYGPAATDVMAIIAERQRINVKLLTDNGDEPFGVVCDILKQVLVGQQSPEQAIQAGQARLAEWLAQRRAMPNPDLPTP
ncbi:MAG: extracellular solute-binding protein [Chloroflexales bacterium]|nr:extracellular solute-binding protein [Chloroflexales bacterium]